VSDPGLSRCGFVAIVGRPNVGKSTLLNRLVGQKVSITSRKPQTTRHRIVGVRTEGPVQVAYVDTPGLHLGARRAINRHMNRTASAALEGVDAVVFVIEALHWTDEDAFVLARLKGVTAPVVVAVNKIDRVKDRRRLLPFLAEVNGRGAFAALVPVSAQSGSNLDRLGQEVALRMPAGEWLFPEDQVTDRSERFLAAEIVREKLMRHLGQEVPYRLAVQIERFEDSGEQVSIDALVWVEKPGQKAIVVGAGGQMLKTVGTEARAELEGILGRRVFLQTWVKVKDGWSDDAGWLRRLGYDER
jgi:GTP-binding protein Era